MQQARLQQSVARHRSLHVDAAVTWTTSRSKVVCFWLRVERERVAREKACARERCVDAWSLGLRGMWHISMFMRLLVQHVSCRRDVRLELLRKHSDLRNVVVLRDVHATHHSRGHADHKRERPHPDPTPSKNLHLSTVLQDDDGSKATVNSQGQTEQQPSRVRDSSDRVVRIGTLATERSLLVHRCV
jgi:hypothetical protein